MIIFMGIAGSGKSTMGQLLAAHLHCPWISTGNLLRQSMDRQTQQKMLRGEIIGDDLTLGVLDEEFRRIGADQNQFVLDGSPRTMRQAKWLVDKAKSGDLKITAIIHLNSGKEVAKERLLNRKRPDDTEDAIAERFREYDNNIVPILKYLEDEGFKVHHIDSERSPEETEAAVERALGINAG
ncbi:MAG TPA: nucleoside monophosphate kinase [Candidatus Saccharimonadales bacterium]|nr:nucleoside monophosphate kinase [Candidatus Saccharimonadales bacterium]